MRWRAAAASSSRLPPSGSSGSSPLPNASTATYISTRWQVCTMITASLACSAWHLAANASRATLGTPRAWAMSATTVAGGALSVGCDSATELSDITSAVGQTTAAVGDDMVITSYPFQMQSRPARSHDCLLYTSH